MIFFSHLPWHSPHLAPTYQFRPMQYTFLNCQTNQRVMHLFSASLKAPGQSSRGLGPGRGGARGGAVVRQLSTALVPRVERSLSPLTSVLAEEQARCFFGRLIFGRLFIGKSHPPPIISPTWASPRVIRLVLVLLFWQVSHKQRSLAHTAHPILPTDPH